MPNEPQSEQAGRVIAGDTASAPVKNPTSPDSINAPASNLTNPVPPPKKESRLIRFLRLRPKLRTWVFVGLALLLALLTTALGYACWIWLLPPVWAWGFSPPTWRGILAFLGAFYLIIIPFIPFGVGYGVFGDILELYVNEQEERIQARFSRLEGSQQTAEAQLEQNDKTGLIPLIRYSRLQLEAYYTIGLSQTQRSFRYSIIAMWIGFVVIVGGLVIKFVPGTPQSVGDLHIISVASGSVIEVISALFLWVYRSSMSQLNYFYNRQMVLHSILLCDRLAMSMTRPDDMKKSIIQGILAHTWEQAYTPPLVAGRVRAKLARRRHESKTPSTA